MATLHPLLRPYVPSSENPFDRVKAAHLLNRAGFGGTEDEIAQVMKTSIQTVKSQLSQAQDRLRRELGAYFDP